MILHHRGSVSTIVAHDTPPLWLSIHRHGSWYPTVVAHDTHHHGLVSTVVAHDTPLSWLMILHCCGLVPTVVAHDTPPSWLSIHRRRSVHFIQGDNHLVRGSNPYGVSVTYFSSIILNLSTVSQLFIAGLSYFIRPGGQIDY